MFAAGDVARFPAPALGGTRRVEHENHANSHGRLVGENMAGAGKPYDYLPYFYSDLFELGYEAIGDTDPRLELVAEWAEPNRKGVVCYVDEGKPRGFLLWDVWDKVDAARELIVAGEPVDRAADPRPDGLSPNAPRPPCAATAAAKRTPLGVLARPGSARAGPGLAHNSVVQNEGHEHVHLVLGDRASVQANVLLLDPGALDVPQGLVRALEAGLDRVLEARGRRRADLGHTCDWHVVLLGRLFRGVC